MYEPFLGMVQYFAFNYAPRGWALCNGALLSLNQNQALYSLLGVQFGGNGQTTFGLPDLRGRTINGFNAGSSMGVKTGTEGATIPASSMPVHTHSGIAKIPVYSNTRSGGDSNDPSGAYFSSPSNGNMYTATPDANTYAGNPNVTVVSAGSGVPFNILNPYLALTCCISLTGIYPSRN